MEKETGLRVAPWSTLVRRAGVEERQRFQNCASANPSMADPMEVDFEDKEMAHCPLLSCCCVRRTLSIEQEDRVQMRDRSAHADERKPIGRTHNLSELTLYK